MPSSCRRFSGVPYFQFMQTMYGANEACRNLAILGALKAYRDRTHFSGRHIWEVDWHSRQAYDAATFMCSC